MEIYDLALAHVWEYDSDFIGLVEKTLHEAGLSTFLISQHNINEVLDNVMKRRLHFNFYLDRAWDVDERYENLGKILTRRKSYLFNEYKKVRHAIDKASMHLEFMTAGLHVPYSIIIPPHSENEDLLLSVDDLAKLGRPFIIKPCITTGGGIGVVTGAETLKEVLSERAVNFNDKYLLQEKIYPKILEGKRAWFRSFWAFGRSIPVWWDDQTHLYETISPEDYRIFRLNRLRRITKKIAELTSLDFFSTEIVQTEEDNFLLIDYVNDQCDMRLKSRHYDGIPDSIVQDIIGNMLRIISWIKSSGDS
ncbi:MAG TPA: hypothetical protein VI230_08655 [Ignavibacteriaceae bacterium]